MSDQGAEYRTDEIIIDSYRLANIGHWEYDLEEKKLYWSEEVKKLHEVAIDFEPDLDTAIAFYEEGSHRDRIIEAVELAIREGKSFEVELKIITAKNNERWIRAVGKSIFKNGKCIRVYGSTQDITELIKKEQKLKESLREKDVLIQEIHHRVKNNLAIVTGLLELQNMVYDESEILKNAINRITSIAMVHEQLYNTDDFSNIDITSYYQRLIQTVLDTIVDDNENIEYSMNVEVDSININLAVPLGLLLNELITNSIKHGFKDQQGFFEVELARNQNQSLRFKYSDNGIGFDVSEFKKTKSFGFELMRTLIKQLQAEYDISGDNGFQLEITFEESFKGSQSNM